MNRLASSFHLRIIAAVTTTMAFTVSACGSDTSIGGDEERPARSTATTDAFVLVEMVPAPETKIAAPFTPIELLFSLDVDPMSVEGVFLRERESKRTVPARVDVAGPRVIVTPLRPLKANQRYTVDVVQIRADASKLPALDVTARFFTAPNFERLHLRYEGGVAVRAHIYNWHPATGDLRIDHVLPGADGILVTPDDLQDAWVRVFYDDDQDNAYTDTRGGPGPDGIYETEDDDRTYVRTMTYGPAGVLTRDYVFFGPDMKAGTADDYTVPTEVHHYDDGDRYAGMCNETECTLRIHGDGEYKVLKLVDPGADGVWRTEDDVLDPTWTRVLIDDIGVEVAAEQHALAADGTPTPTDTTMLGYTTIKLERSLPVEVRIYSGVGPDGLWRTEDDVADRLMQTSYDTDGWTRTHVVYETGDDGLLDTPDDVLIAQWVF